MSQVLPFLTEFGLQPDLEEQEAENATNDALETVVPYGRDYGFDPFLRDISLTADGDIRIVSEEAALRHWVWAANTVPANSEIIYSAAFGSELLDLIGRGLPQNAVLTAVRSRIIDAISAHDRIVRLDDLNVQYTSDDGLIYFTGTVIKDDSSRLQFEGSIVG